MTPGTAASSSRRPSPSSRTKTPHSQCWRNYQKEKNGWGLQFLPASGTIYPNAGRIIPINRNTGEPGFNRYDNEIASVGYLFAHNINDNLTFRQNLRYSWMHNEIRQHQCRRLPRRSRRAALPLRRIIGLDDQLHRRRQPAGGPLHHWHPEPHHAVRHRLSKHDIDRRQHELQRRSPQRLQPRLHQHLDQGARSTKTIA